MKISQRILIAIFALLGAATDVVGEPAHGSFTFGMLTAVGARSDPPIAFVQALNELGYREGINLRIIHREVKESNAELPALAAELVALKPDVLLSAGTPPSLALKNATASIPIVMVSVGDPIKSGLVQSLARPGGNVTGTGNASELLVTKIIQAIPETLPGIRCVLAIENPTNPAIVEARDKSDDVAAKLGFAFRKIEDRTAEQLDRALSAPPDENCNGALLLSPDPLLIARRSQIADYALRYRVALFARFRADAEAGALMAFGANLDEQWRLAAIYVDRILKGEKPADIPVQLPTKFEIVVNLKTAKAIGVTIPQSILAEATEVIE